MVHPMNILHDYMQFMWLIFCQVIVILRCVFAQDVADWTSVSELKG